MQHLQPLRRKLRVQRGHAREVAARSVQAGDKSKLHRVAPGGEDDWNCRSRRFGRQCRRNSDPRRSRPPVGEPGRPPVPGTDHLTLRPAVFDRHVAALDIANFAQSLAKRAHAFADRLGRARIRNPITGIASCCARATTGHAAAVPPRNLRKSRRRMSAPRLRTTPWYWFETRLVKRPPHVRFGS